MNDDTKGTDGKSVGSNDLLGDAHHNEERYLIDVLQRLEEEYIKAAQPYFSRLAAIRERRRNCAAGVAGRHE